MSKKRPTRKLIANLLARALGIRAAQEGLGADSVLDSPEMRELCSGRDSRSVKILVGCFVDGWRDQDLTSKATK